jgi:ArsR family metal-binding transcriptional regulator
MDEQRTQYTFTFGADDEKTFRRIQSRLDDDEYTVVKDIERVVPDNSYSDLTTTIIMVPEAASTFRFGMKKVNIRRFRTEEELAAEEAEAAKNRITITVKVDGYEKPTP